MRALYFARRGLIYLEFINNRLLNLEPISYDGFEAKLAVLREGHVIKSHVFGTQKTTYVR